MGHSSYRYISAKETAQLVRQALRKAFPHFKKFSVKMDRYGNIAVRWTDGPGSFYVRSVFEGYEFDGHYDSWDSHTTMFNGEEVHFGVKNVSCQRTYTRTFVDNVVAQFCYKFGVKREHIRITGSTWEEAWIDCSRVGRFTGEALQMLLEQTDAKDQFNVFGAQEKREAEHRARREQEEEELRQQREQEEAEERQRKADEEQFNNQSRKSTKGIKDLQKIHALSSKLTARNYLNVSMTAERQEVMNAFRALAQQAHDGKGGFVPGTDLDFLRLVRDKALS